jgi:hypothetical protein
MYLTSTNKELEDDVWLIESSEYFHMTPHKVWLCEYDKYEGGDVFFGDE